MSRAGIPLGLLAMVCIAALWVSQCSGPRPVVDGEPMVRAPEQPGQAYHVDAAIRNSGPGHGEVQVTFMLRNRATGQTYQHSDRAQLESGDVVHVVASIPAPPGDYDPRVLVDYPPG